MKVRFKLTSSTIWHSTRFNIHGLGEIIIMNTNLGADSTYIKDLDVFIESKQEWKDMGQAFKDKDIIIDNYNTMFFEPSNDEDKQRGFTL